MLLALLFVVVNVIGNCQVVVETLINWSWAEELQELGYNTEGSKLPELVDRNLFNPIYWLMTKKERHQAERYIGSIKKFVGEAMKNGNYFSLNNTDMSVRRKVLQKLFLQWLQNYRLSMVNAPGIMASVIDGISSIDQSKYEAHEIRGVDLLGPLWKQPDGKFWKIPEDLRTLFDQPRFSWPWFVDKNDHSKKTARDRKQELDKWVDSSEALIRKLEDT